MRAQLGGVWQRYVYAGERVLEETQESGALETEAEAGRDRGIPGTPYQIMRGNSAVELGE